MYYTLLKPTLLGTVTIETTERHVQERMFEVNNNFYVFDPDTIKALLKDKIYDSYLESFAKSAKYDIKKLSFLPMKTGDRYQIIGSVRKHKNKRKLFVVISLYAVGYGTVITNVRVNGVHGTLINQSQVPTFYSDTFVAYTANDANVATLVKNNKLGYNRERTLAPFLDGYLDVNTKESITLEPSPTHHYNEISLYNINIENKKFNNGVKVKSDDGVVYTFEMSEAIKKQLSDGNTISVIIRVYENHRMSITRIEIGTLSIETMALPTDLLKGYSVILATNKETYTGAMVE